MFLLLMPIFQAMVAVAQVVVSVVMAVVKVVVKVAVAAVKMVARAVLRRVTGIRDNPLWDALIFRHIDWKRAMLGQEEQDKEVSKAEDEWGKDDNGDGIPDRYNDEVTSPAADFLHIKYPFSQRLLVENDYIRSSPRVRGALPSVVAPGAKGIVRSAFWDTQGAWAQVKWNIFSLGENRPSITHLVNQMDLHLLGHVNPSMRVTE